MASTSPRSAQEAAEIAHDEAKARVAALTARASSEAENALTAGTRDLERVRKRLDEPRAERAGRQGRQR